MKKFTICIALLLALVMGGSAMASSVTYIDRDELFDFKPGSVYEVTDLFENFKNVLPGDVYEQQITVRNSSDGQVRIWLQCKYDSYVTTDAKDFLDQLKLTVVSRDTTIFEAAADEKAQLTEPRLLGTFRKNGQVELTVRLEVPAELDSRYMGQVGVVPWTFLIEEIPEDDTPDTGDWFEAGIWGGAAALLALAILVLLLMQRRKRAEQH